MLLQLVNWNVAIRGFSHWFANYGLSLKTCLQVGMESEGFAIYDAMMQLKNEVGLSCLNHLLFFYEYLLGPFQGVNCMNIMETSL